MTYDEVHREGARDGYVDTASAARRHGLDPHALARHLARLGWEPHLPGYWLPGGVAPTFTARCTITLAYVGEPSLLTGAAALHCLGVLPTAPKDVELLLPARRWLQPRDGVCIHYASDFAALRSVTAQGLRCVRADRAIADHSAHATLNGVCRVIADAVRLRRCTLAQVGQLVASRQRFPGRGRLRRAHAALSGELNHSGYERLGRRLLREAGVTVASRPEPVLRHGRPVAEIDLPFFEVDYGLEIDGPHHLLPKQAAADRARDRTLAQTSGIDIDRYLWFELEEEPRRFVREVVARLRALGSAAAPPTDR